MSYEPCTSLLDMEADCLPTSSLDTSPLSQSSGTHTPARYSGSEQKKAGSPDCMCGKGTSDCLIHPSTRDKWIASMRASLAQIFQQPVIRQELAKKRAVGSTVKPYASLAWFDQSTSTWKTSQPSLLTGLAPSCLTWPLSGMTANGFAYELPIVGRIMSGIDGGSWPTPVASDCKGSVRLELANKRRAESKVGRRLPETISTRYQLEVGGRMNPQFSEWLMSFPIGFTESKASGTRKFHSKPQSPGSCSEGLEA